METFFYWAEVLETLRIISIIFCTIAVILGSVLYGCFLGDHYRYDGTENVTLSKFEKKVIRICFTTFFVTLPLGIFLPSKATMYKMKGVGIIQEIMNNANAEKIPEKTFQLIDKYLSKELEKYNEN